MSFEKTSVTYNDLPFAAYYDNGAEPQQHYFPQRIQQRVLIDFGLVSKGERGEFNLGASNIDQPLLVKSLHAPSSSTTDDTVVWEIHHEKGQGVQQRFSLQYAGKNEMPMSIPELILFPENVIYAIPSQDSRIFLVCEEIIVKYAVVPMF